jgi:hypothetical protein
LLEGLPPNPFVGLYKWLAFDLKKFMQPWYPPITTKPTSKLPYQKLQYPTYMKDINPNVHIKVFKKIIKINGKTMEVDIINMFGFTLKDNILEWVRTLYKIIPIAHLKSWSKHFANISKQ